MFLFPERHFRNTDIFPINFFNTIIHSILAAAKYLTCKYTAWITFPSWSRYPHSWTHYPHWMYNQLLLKLSLAGKSLWNPAPYRDPSLSDRCGISIGWYHTWIKKFLKSEELEITVLFTRIHPIYSIVTKSGQSICTVYSLIKILNQL